MTLDLPLAFTRIVVGAFGLIVGSFLNVVVHRVPRGESIVTPRSRCPGCGRLIPAIENIPVVSWLALRGRCAGCGGRIAWRYPAVELLTALLFVACFEVFGATPALLIALPFVGAVLALVFMDLEHMLLPDSVTLPVTFLGLLVSFASPLTTPADALLGVMLAWFLVEGLNLAYKLVRGRDGFGGGDTKMLMMVGAVLGWRMTLLTLVLGSFTGVILGIPALAAARRRRGDAIPAPPPRAPEPAPTPARDAAVDAGEAPEPAPVPAEAPEAAMDDERPTLRDLLPQSIDEALPLVLVPASAVSWLFAEGSPERALAGLLAGIAISVIVDAALRRGGRESPLLHVLPVVGALLGLPPHPVAVLGGAALVLALVVLFRPAVVAGRPPRDSEHQPDEHDAPPLMQAELPFGVFLGAGAILALLVGQPLVDWYASLTVGAVASLGR